MKIDLKKFDALIFDLGGVILDINPDLTWDAFKKIASPEYKQQFIPNGLLRDFETGKIHMAAFIDRINVLLGTQLNEIQFKAAWNAMLLDYKPMRIEKIKTLKQSHKLFLLSNTNSIHFNFFSQKLINEYGLSFTDLFNTVYVSHEIGLIKPDLAIFKTVLSQQNLNPQHTLFIEDTQENAEAAQKLGIQTLVIPRNGNFYDYFD
jgi:putative hydrolase of the HAD superfamily